MNEVDSGNGYPAQRGIEVKTNRIMSFLLAATAAAMISGCAAAAPLTQALANGAASGSGVTAQPAEVRTTGTMQVAKPANDHDCCRRG